MKAIITSDDGVNLQLSLAAEGANDHTLFGLLARQYPALRYENQHVLVPIFRGHQEQLTPAELCIRSVMLSRDSSSLNGGTRYHINEIHAASAATIHAGSLVVEDRAQWKINGVYVNGRQQQMMNDHYVLEDIVAEAHVEIEVERSVDLPPSSARKEEFVARIMPGFHAHT